jgi:alanyl-tRNA synthetase
MKALDIRQKFLDFFASKGHQIVASAPMVLKNDPTLMFTNAGMNQFKDIFLGNEPAKHNRVADTQKCLRVSGKHNDLEEVGVDTYHHTMFEMLGNWSFGDYYKKEAIEWAWELLTKEYGINPDNLYVTYFEGDPSENLPMDTEAYDLWKALVPESRILPGNKKDNFWEMGETGPCGPCSEIHVDLRTDAEKAAVPGSKLVNNDHPQVVEIWNLVFMEMNRQANGTLNNLPAKHIDTGMGFERLTMALQGKRSNYDTDIFQPIIGRIEELSGLKYTATDEKKDIAFRVISDHIRAISFAIADGQLPSNTGAGYVIRRILRRAVRYAFSFLNMKEPFMWQLVAVLEREMGKFFPELVSQRGLIENVIREEEEAFLRTLERGIVLIESVIKESKSDVVDGKKAFELYDTFGFPIDLTRLILSESGKTVDEAAFHEELEKQKTRSRQATAIEAADWVELKSLNLSEFIGYDHKQAAVNITRYREIVVQKNKQYQLVFDRTPFYPEGGGQVGDTGYIENGEEKIQILDTKKENNLIIHLCDKLPKQPEADFRAVVDVEKQALTACNHSATHLLHHTLRAVLGTHVEQKGSLVNADYLRFDFSHFAKVSESDLKEIENRVNREIWNNIPLQEHRNTSMEKARNMGAMALFGEKYGDSVRVIQFGDSVELCGGIHVPGTGNIGLFKITSEGGIAAGIRRIEAVTNATALKFFNDQLNLLNEARAALKNPHDVLKAIKELSDNNSLLQKELEKERMARAGNLKGDLLSNAEVINGITFVAAKVDLDAGSIKNLAFQMKDQVEQLFLILASEADGKVVLSVALSDALVNDKQLDAGKVIRELAPLVGGGGGGQKFFATAGGKNPAGINAALLQARSYLS